MLRPDGSRAPGPPSIRGSIWGAWAVSIDGNDHVWISNFAPGGGLTELCGARTETCPAGMKTGDPISPPGGYMGGDMQMLVDVSIDPAGNVWVANNWQDYWSCFGTPDEGVSTRCGGHGLSCSTAWPSPSAPLRSDRRVGINLMMATLRAHESVGGLPVAGGNQWNAFSISCFGHSS